VSGHAAAPPSSVMNSRRLNRSNCIRSPASQGRIAEYRISEDQSGGSETRARPITDQIPSAVRRASLLADQQKKHSDSDQHRNQNTDDQRNNPMPIYGRLRSSALLRCSDAQPEEKFVHSGPSSALLCGSMLRLRRTSPLGERQVPKSGPGIPRSTAPRTVAPGLTAPPTWTPGLTAPPI